MPATIAELRAALQINKHELDEEIVRQPVLYDEVCDQVVEAVSTRDASKEELETVDAELANKYRAKTKDGKVTEKLIANFVQLDPKHEEAFFAWLDAKKSADKLLNLQRSFEQRKDMLKSLVHLYSMNFNQDASIRSADTSQYSVNRSRMSNARAARAKGGK